MQAANAIEKKYFGTLVTGEEVFLFILRADPFVATFTNWGATWTSFLMPDARGQVDDVLLGFSTLEGYTGKHPYFGSTIGRFANRIAGGEFEIDGVKYHLWINDSKNHLHGGRRGFNKYLWNYDLSMVGGDPAVTFWRISPDGEEGYPGNLSVWLTVSLSPKGELKLHYQARSDAKTLANLTNHAYFNLAGEGKGSILNHVLQLNSSLYLPVDNTLIPTGEIKPTQGTAFDFKKAKPIGQDIQAAGGGYDHCFIIDDGCQAPLEFAHVWEPSTSRSMAIATTLPGVQFYTGNNLSGVVGKAGSIYDKYSGFCLETELYPDSVHHSQFPSAILNPGEVWEHETIYAFSVS